MKKSGMIYCNCCGKLICEESRKDRVSYLEIRKRWGYFSDNRDGKIYLVDICEDCCRHLEASMVLPPEIKDTTEFV